MLTVKVGFIAALILCHLYCFFLPLRGALYFVTKHEVDENVFAYIGNAQFSNGLCISIWKLKCLIS